jgi:MFS family permease
VRRLLVLVSSIIFVDALLFGALTPLVPGYADEFDLSKAGAGLLVAAFGAGALVGGIPGGISARYLGPKTTVILGLCLLGVASIAFAAADAAWSLGLARLLQGLSSTTTWAGALAWLTVETPAARRGQTLGTAFGAAVSGAILGPMFGAGADVIGVPAAFAIVGAIAFLLAVWAATGPASAPEQQAPGALARAFHDPRFIGGLWLNTLPALLFGTLAVLAPLALADAGYTPVAIGAVFLAAGVIEVALNPVIGRYSDRVGRLLPIRLALAASVAASAAFALADEAAVLTLLVCVAAVAWGAFYTPGMALVSDRAEAAGLAQGLAFGVMNTAWAVGNLTGPAAGGALADRFGDPVPYLAGGALCLLTLLAALRVARGRRSIRRAEELVPR